MLPLSSTKKKFITIIFITAVLVVVYILFFRLISTTNRGLAQLEYELDLEINNEAQLKILNDTISETVEERALMDSYFIAKDGVVDFINTLESFAKEVGVKSDIISVDIKDGPEDIVLDKFEKLNIEIRVEGPWGGVFHFMKLFSSIPYQVDINKMVLDTPKVESGESRADSPVWSGLLNIDVLKIK